MSYYKGKLRGFGAVMLIMVFAIAMSITGIIGSFNAYAWEGDISEQGEFLQDAIEFNVANTNIVLYDASSEDDYNYIIMNPEADTDDYLNGAGPFYFLQKGDTCTLRFSEAPTEVTFVYDDYHWYNDTYGEIYLSSETDYGQWQPGGDNYFTLTYSLDWNDGNNWQTSTATGRIPVTLKSHEEYELIKAKESAIQNIRFQLLGEGDEYENPLENYRTAQQKQIKKLVSDAEAAINASVSKEEIETIENDTLNAFYKVFTRENLDMIDLYYGEGVENVSVFGEESWLELYSKANRPIAEGYVSDGKAKLKALRDNAYGPIEDRQFDTAYEYVEEFENVYSEVYENVHSVETREYVSELIVKLSKTRFTYNGKVQKPSVTVIADGVTMPASEYKIIWPKGMKNAGDYFVEVEMTDNYIGNNGEHYAIAKASNPLVANGKTATVKFASLKKKNQTVAVKSAFSVSKNEGKVTYKKTSGNSKITVAANGKITVKKGLKKGTYKIKVNVKAAGSTNYKSVTKKVTVTIKVK